MRARVWIILLVSAALCVGLAHALDRTLLDALAFDGVYDDDWGRALRVLGYVPVWFVVSLVFVLIDRGRRDTLRAPLRDAHTRGVLLSLSALSAGGVAEGLKMLLRRERPGEDLAYSFRPFAEATWSTSGLGLPSSHAAVAAGACAMLCLLHPRATPVFALLAAGCAATRVSAGAHYPSDAVLGLVVGVACAMAWWTLHMRNLRGDSLSGGGDDA